MNASPTFVSPPPGDTVFPLASSSVSPGCQRCETLPDKMQGPGLLHLRFPLTHSLGKMLEWLRRERFSFAQDKGTLSVEINDVDLTSFALALSSQFSPTEQHDVHAIFQKRDQVMQLADYLDAQSLTHFIARSQTGWLIELMNQERLTTHYQPILHARSGEIFAYEGLMRGTEANNFVSPARMLGVARDSGMLFQLDLAARRSAIRGATAHGLKGKIFINFTPTAIYDPVFCLKSTIELIAECGFAPTDVVFEIIETEHVNDTSHLISILKFYRERGFGVALDDLGSGYSSLNLLAALHPDYVKLDRELIAGVHLDPFKAIIAQKMLETSQSLGIKTVAEGVEEREEMQWLQQNGADYMQGYLFARPAAPPHAVNWPL